MADPIAAASRKATVCLANLDRIAAGLTIDIDPKEAPEAAPQSTPEWRISAYNPGSPQTAPQASMAFQHPPPTPELHQAKRRKTDVVPGWEHLPPQWEQQQGEPQSRAQIEEQTQRPWATVNPPLLPVQTLNPGNKQPVDLERPIWAAVNQPRVPPRGEGMENNGAGPQARGEKVEDDTPVPMIDGLPKNKQRQVYGLVSGIQAGIEHLQRELNQLKKALGIFDE